MEAIGIPDTLLHNDMNTGNILVNGTRAVFTDWAEACVGNPFVTFQHLRIQAEREDATHTWSPSLTALYKQHWRTLLGESQIEEAFALVPPLAIASYLCGRDMSFSASYRNDTRAHSYARSLARHMDRAAQNPEFLEAVCH
jgi:aminoglycoside phosphotransferase (APT) family kinase protein